MKNILCGILLVFTAVSGFAQVDRSKAPQPGPAPKIQLGKYETFTLKNGLKVIVVENHKLPTVDYSLVLENDPMFEGGKAGYSTIMGEMLARGTKNRTKAQLDEAIDLIGAQLYTSSGGLSGSCLKKHNEKLLELMADVILNPSFPQEEMDKVVKQTKDGLEANKTDAGAIVSNIISKVAYGNGHPYSDVVTDSTLGNITLADIKDCYSKFVMPNVAYLAVVGDVTKGEIQPLLEKYFGGWAKGTPQKSKITTPTPPANAQIEMFDRAGSAQTTLRFVYPIQNTVGGADYLKIRLLNNILGGGATGRLFMNLREKHGYTYGAYSSMTADKYAGLFTASADVRTEVTDSAIFQFIYEMNEIATKGVTETELASSKSELTGAFAIGLENPQTVANFAINIDRYKLPKDYYANYLTNLNAVTVADVNAAAATYVLPYNFHLVVVGDRSKIEKKITRYDSDQKITFLDAFGNPAPELKAVPENVTLQTVMDGYITAIGGKDAITKVKDYTATGKMITQFGTIEFKAVNKFPDKSYSLFTLSGAVVQNEVFDGKAGKSSGMQGSSTFSEGEVKDAKADALLAFESDLSGAGITGNLLGIDIVDGVDAYKVELTYPSGKKIFCWYSVKTGLKIRRLDIAKSDQGDMEIVTVYSDYRDISGIKYPFYQKNSIGELVIDKIDVNTNVADDFFLVK